MRASFFIISILLLPQVLFSQTTGTVKWEYQIPDEIYPSPAIDNNGTVYIGLYSTFYAFNSDGTVKWQTGRIGPLESSAVIGSDGTIYVGCETEKLYAYNPDGTKKWTFETKYRNFSDPAISYDGTIYVCCYKRIYAINPDGTKKWELKTDSYVGSPVIGSDGTMYVSYEKKLHAINPDGTKKWEYESEDFTFSEAFTTAAIGSDGVVYVGSLGYDNKLYAFNPDGTKKWDFEGINRFRSSPVIGPDGTIYAGSGSKLYAINPDGTKTWEFTAESTVYSPTIGSLGTVYIGTATIKQGAYDIFYAINPDGTKKWELETKGQITGSSAIDSEGTLYVSCWLEYRTLNREGRLYAIYTDSEGLAESPWPKYHRNNKNTACADSSLINAEFKAEPISGIVPLMVQFSDSSAGSISTRLWDFGDGNSSAELNPSHTFADTGIYTISLTVSGDEGVNTETKMDFITVALPAPIPDFIADKTSVSVDSLVSFTDMSTGEISSWHWDFGDYETSLEQSPSHAYSYSGTYTVDLIVFGPGGGTRERKTDYITVTAPAPLADFTADITSVYTDSVVNFSDNSTGEISDWSWNFGDGGTSIDRNPSHIYTVPGTYSVSLTVTGSGGDNTVTKTDYISVESLTDIFDLTSGSRMVLYPNPSKTTCTVKLHDEISGKITVRIFSSNGVKLITKTDIIEKVFNLDVSGLNEGLYYISIVSDMETITKELIISR